MSSRESASGRILDAALKLAERRGGMQATMAEIAKRAGVSRQAVYLHFADRGALFVALARHADEKAGIVAEARAIDEAPTAVAALGIAVAIQARFNPKIYAVARALDAIRRTDPAAERALQDRSAYRLAACRQIVARLRQEGRLRRELEPEAAADLLWALIALKVWEDLVLGRGWTAQQYTAHVTRLIEDALVEPG